MKKSIKNIKKIDIKSLGIVVGIILLFSTTIAMAQSSNNIQSSESVGPGKVISWDNLPKGNIGNSNEKEIPVMYIKYINKRRPQSPIENIVHRNDIDTSVIPQQLSQISQQSFQPTLLSSWDSLDNMLNANLNGYTVRPPDPIIATGPSYVGVMVNDIIAFYTKSGTLKREAGLPNWYGFGSCTGCFISDPRIVYDQNEGHWATIALGIDSSTSPYTTYYLLTVSQTPDPTGNWYGYKIPSNLFDGVNTWSDYPDIGFDGIQSSNGGAIYITSNQFDAAGNFITASLSILPKSSLYTGVGFSFWSYYGMTNANGFPADTLRATQTFGNPGVEYLVDSENVGAGYDNNVTLWSVVPAYPPNAANIVNTNIPIGSFNPPPSAHQYGGGNTYLLDTIDNRIYNAVYRNGNVYAAFTEANGTVSSIRYLQLNTSTNSPDLNVRYGASGKYYWFPSIMTDNSNNIDLVFAYSSPTEYAGIRYTTLKTTDKTTEPSAILTTGQVTIQGFRWGDYFGIAKDPIDNSVWIYGEYAKNIRRISKVWDWGTFVGRVTN